MADELNATAERLWRQAETMNGVHATIVAPYWSGVAAEVFAERVRRVIDGLQVAATRHREGADAARSWSGELSEAQRAADHALQAAEEAEADLARAEVSLGMIQAAHSREDAYVRLDEARARARTVKDQYDTAERAFVRRVDATLSGAIPHASRPELEDFVAVFGMLTRASSPAGLLDLLSTRTPDEVAKQLAQNPQLAQWFWDSPPPPEAVASWWKGLPSEARERWCQAAPTIIGNLPGLDADTRIHANTIQLRRDLTDGSIAPDSPQGIVLRDILKALRVDVFSGLGLDFEELAKALDPARGLLAYNLRHEPPLAAVAVGQTNAERNGKVTWAVPGMNSGLGEPGRLTGWTGAAVNLYNEQERLEPGVAHLMVAWVGYDAPRLDTVLNGDQARQGGARLTRELNGQWAADTILGGNPAPYTAVVGHSYGTTVTTNAATDLTHNVQSMVLLASAGVERSIPTVDALNVDGGGQHVYVSQASRDVVADRGRWSGRGDPRDDSFGAYEFSSEGDPTQNLEPTDGHDVIGYGADNGSWLNEHASKGHGYLDRRTEALHNSAAASIGLDGKINGGTTQGKKK